MIWFYQRAGRHLYYEIRLRQNGPGFELGITASDGPLLTERFESEEELSRRFAQLDDALSREGWDRCEPQAESAGAPHEPGGRSRTH